MRGKQKIEDSRKEYKRKKGNFETETFGILKNLREDISRKFSRDLRAKEVCVRTFLVEEEILGKKFKWRKEEIWSVAFMEEVATM